MAALVSDQVPNTFTSNVRRKISSVSASRSWWGTTVVQPCVVHEDVEATEALDGAVEQALHLRLDRRCRPARRATRSGSAIATASPASTEVALFTTTLAPSCERRRAIAAPMPLDDPVTMATFPSNSPITAS